MGERTEPPSYLNPRSLVRTLVEATSRALRGHDCSDLGTSRIGRSASTAKRFAIPVHQVDDVDVEAVAGWIVRQYPRPTYSGVVMGSPHGAAIHLAVAMGAPWLPTGFDIAVHWPDGSPTDVAAAMAHGIAASSRVRGNRTVRQVHDPVGAGTMSGRTATLHLRWPTLPAAYNEFLSANLARGAFAILLCDDRQWPVFNGSDGYSFQLGSPSSGLGIDDYLSGRKEVGADRDHGEFGVEPGIEVDLRRWACRNGGQAYTVCYSGPEVLSAAVADAYRQWLRRCGKTGRRLVMESGRLVDPYHVVRAGLVPYWCERATRAAATAAELWVAASQLFTSIDVFPEPVGASRSHLASKQQWSALTRFATRRGVVHTGMSRAYPWRTAAPRHATAALRAHPYDYPVPPPLTVDAAIASLRDHAALGGLRLSPAPGA